MSLRLEVECRTGLGNEASLSDEVGVCGSILALGSWEPVASLRMNLVAGDDDGTSAVWFVDVPDQAVPPGTAFKFVILKGGGVEPAWEPLEENRLWPSDDVGDGTVLRAFFGQTRMRVQAGDAVLAAKARKTSCRDTGCALQQNIDRKGENAYYHAHNRTFEVPDDAQVITGPGLVTGGAPTLLETGGVAVDDEDRVAMLKDYSWSDSTDKVKVYVPLPEGFLPAEGAEGLVEATFDTHQVDLLILGKPRQRLKIEKLNAEIKAAECSTRVEASKNRVVLLLMKKRNNTWYNLTKK